MALENLNVPDKIVIVLQENENTEYIPHGYVVDPSDENALDRARSWALSRASKGGYGTSRLIEPKEHYFNNEGFKLTLFDSAHESSRGGKQSFWNCLIEKDDMRAIIGINQTGLLSLLKQSTVIRGIVQEGLSLSPSTSTAVALHSGMDEWKETKQMRAKQIKEANIKRTSKWEIGKTYKSATSTYLYLGNVYKWFDCRLEVKEIINEHMARCRETHYHYRLLDEPIIVKNILALEHPFYGIVKEIHNKEIKTLKEMYSYLTKIAEDRSHNTDRKLVDGTDNLLSKQLVKTSSRFTGEIQLINDDEDGKARQAYFKKLHSIYLNLLTNGMEIYGDISDKLIGISVEATDKPVFSEEIKNLILNRCSKTVHIDFGDGVELTGRKSK